MAKQTFGERSGGGTGRGARRYRWVGALTALTCGGFVGACVAPSEEVDGSEEAAGVVEEGLTTCTTFVRAPTVQSVQDTTIVQDPLNPARADQNFGTTPTLTTGKLASATRLSLLRFELSPLPASLVITGAKLRLSRGADVMPGNVEVFRASAPWTESSVTWNSFGNAFDASAPVASLTPISAPIGGQISVDVTAAVQAWVDGSVPNHGFVLSAPDGNRATFGSSDSNTPSTFPQLTVCYVSATCSDGVQNGAETGVDCGSSCGPCGTDAGCLVDSDCQSGVCLGGLCQAPTCNDGVQNGTEVATDCGGSCVLPEYCNGIDDDCDGQADEGNPDGGGSCSTGIPGACSTGVLTCTSGALACVASVSPSAESCNGIDDDCNGVVDEGNPGGNAACSTGLLGACAVGTTTCTSGALACVASVSPSAESCNGIDDDCNGVVDEGNPGGGAACSTGLPGVCSAGTTTCTGGALACIANSPGSPETCDGFDNDCDGVVDDGVAVSGTLASWPAEGDANDALGTYDGTLLGGMGFGSGVAGSAFLFDGVDDAATFGTTLGNFGTSDFTVEFWINTKSTRLEGLIGKRAVCGSGSFFDLRLSSGKVKAEIAQTGSAVNSHTSSQSVNDGTWHHVAFVRQGKTLLLYVDGALDSSKVTAATSSVSNSASFSMAEHVCIGVDSTQRFTGQLDDVHVFGRALTAAEVAQLESQQGGACVSP